MKILVTGSAGFIGYHLCKSLLDDGYQVWGIDNLNDYYDVSLKNSRLDKLKNKNFPLKRLIYQIKKNYKKLLNILNQRK